MDSKFTVPPIMVTITVRSYMKVSQRYKDKINLPFKSLSEFMVFLLSKEGKGVKDHKCELFKVDMEELFTYLKEETNTFSEYLWDILD